DQEIYPTMPPVQVPGWEDPMIITMMNLEPVDSIVTLKVSSSTNTLPSTLANSNQFLYLELMMEEMKATMMNTNGELELTLPMPVAEEEQQQQHPAMVDSAAPSSGNLPTEECRYGATTPLDIEGSVWEKSTLTMGKDSPPKRFGTPNQDHLNKQSEMLWDTTQMRSTIPTH